MTYDDDTTPRVHLDIKPEDKPSFKRVKVSKEIKDLILEIQKNNPQWGPDRIAAHIRLIRKIQGVTPDHVRSVLIPEK